MNKPDNVVYNYKTKKYDAYSKEYPTSFSSKSFTVDKIKKFKYEAQNHFISKIEEIKSEYDKLTEQLKWNNMIAESSYNFNPIVGKTYYLYEKNNKKFLSIIEPKEWEMKLVGEFILNTNYVWEKKQNIK
jgi:hypothetical protein|tara:strand:+ start:295 stop:684 length:390 start_codon:yes stop_codon:yes gene_type:complete